MSLRGRRSAVTLAGWVRCRALSVSVERRCLSSTGSSAQVLSPGKFLDFQLATPRFQAQRSALAPRGARRSRLLAAVPRHAPEVSPTSLLSSQKESDPRLFLTEAASGQSGRVFKIKQAPRLFPLRRRREKQRKLENSQTSREAVELLLGG